ncbi:MAG: ABC transporter ATP-binding protein [Hyphomicrobium sp.]
MNAVIIEKTGKDYGGNTVLDGVSLNIPEGKCLALIGHNGAGKTTLMKLMLGLIHPTHGRVEVLGVNPAAGGKALRQKLGFLPENVAFHDELTGEGTLAFYARLKGVEPEQSSRLLERVGLTNAASRRVKTYSKGMRQRLGLAQALLGEPKLLLLDEPTTGLDPLLRQEFFQIIRELTAAGTTVVLSSHILTELEARTDLTAILRDGRLAAFGDLDTLRRQAELQVTVRVRGDAPAIARKLNGAFHKTVGADHAFIDIDCLPSQKMALLRTLSGFGDLCSDLDVRPPSLDDLYLYYCGHALSSTDKLEAHHD